MIEKFPEEIGVDDSDLSILQKNKNQGFFLLLHACMGWIYCYKLCVSELKIGLAIRWYVRILINIIYKK